MTKKIKLSTFAILVAFIAIIAVSCSERATEPEVSLSESTTVQPGDTVQPGGDGSSTEQPGGTVQPNPSVSYNSIADLYGKTLRVKDFVDGGVWYVWVKVESDKIQYGRDVMSLAHTDLFKSATLSADGSFVNAKREGKIEVKNGSATITFTKIDLEPRETLYLELNKAYTLIEK